MLKYFSVLSVFISLVIFTSCDSIDLYTYAKDGMYGPHFTTFSINGNTGVINTKKCTVAVYLSDTGLTGLTPVFTISGKRVVYNGSDIASGTLPIDFTSPQVFTIYSKLGNSCDFTVTVHAAEGLVITPDDPSISIGQNLQLYAAFTYANGHTQSASGVAWSVTSGTAATVNSTTGLITGSATGPATITATHAASGYTDTVTVTVYEAPYIELSIYSTSITSGDTLTVFISCTYTALGSTTDVTSLITWTENDPGTVRFDSYSGGALTIHGWSTTGVGSLTATYTAGNVQTDLSVTVNPRTDFYVAPATAIPTAAAGNPGSKAYPILTISEAMIKAGASGGGTVHVMRGTYNETVYLQDGVSLKGSYDTSFTNQDIAYPSIIQSTDAGKGAIDYTGNLIANDIIIDCFELYALDGTASGNASSAVRISNGSNTGTVTIERCVLHAEAAVSSYQSSGIGIFYCNSIIRNNIIIGGISSSKVYGIIVAGSLTKVYIFNNVIDCGNSDIARYGIYILEANPDIINNIIYVPAVSSATGSSAINEAIASSDPENLDTNILYVENLGASFDYLYYDNTFGAINVIDDLFTNTVATSTGTNYSFDPQFSYPTYELLDTSPARGILYVGTDLSNYVSGFYFDNDLDGDPARTDPWTIGPYEY